ncbi:MAG: cyanophycin synthetase, partial [Alphaproteobacteria bacterium]|nr:cyanophycin synthetase [Alphaproteobacteria bacterium]
MKVIQTAIYEGPNVYAPIQVIRWRVDLGALEDWPTGRLGTDFTEALLDRLPGLDGQGGSEGAPGDFARAMVEKDGVSLGQVLAHTAIELQRLGGADVSFAGAWPAGRPGVYDVVYGYEAKEVGMAALKLAGALIANILPAETRSEPYS